MLEAVIVGSAVFCVLTCLSTAWFVWREIARTDKVLIQMGVSMLEVMEEQERLRTAMKLGLEAMQLVARRMDNVEDFKNEWSELDRTKLN